MLPLGWKLGWLIFLGALDALDAPGVELEALVASGLEARVALLEVEVLDSPGVEVEALIAPGLGAGLALLVVGVLDAPGLESEVGFLGAGWLKTYKAV